LIVLRTIAEVREFRKDAGKVGFVPTMGALHAGHIHLMYEAVKDCDVAMGSIFVNPLQFGENEDLSVYPRREAEDLALAEEVGVVAMFCPSAEEMVGSNQTTVSVAGVSDLFEGEKRPGHFDGVATIVARLFGIILPDVAYFGLKDLQQCAVIRQMVTDLCLPVTLQFVETVREASGLALSSRNGYFSDSDRVRAAGLNKILRLKAQQILLDDLSIESILTDGIAELRAMNFDVEYLELVDPTTMKPVRFVDARLRLIVAAKFCGVRLIDNIALNA
jgi:pantoate--beta-alanine ligase